MTCKSQLRIVSNHAKTTRCTLAHMESIKSKNYHWLVKVKVKVKPAFVKTVRFSPISLNRFLNCTKNSIGIRAILLYVFFCIILHQAGMRGYISPYQVKVSTFKYYENSLLYKCILFIYSMVDNWLNEALAEFNQASTME